MTSPSPFVISPIVTSMPERVDLGSCNLSYGYETLCGVLTHKDNKIVFKKNKKCLESKLQIRVGGAIDVNIALQTVFDCFSLIPPMNCIHNEGPFILGAFYLQKCGGHPKC
jgi:hypothetical protein